MLEGVWTGLDRWARIPGLPKDRCVLLIDRKPRKLRNNRSDRCRGLWCLALLVPAQAAVIGHGESTLLANTGKTSRVSSVMEMILSRWTADPKMDKDLPVVHVGPSSDQEIEHLVKEDRWAPRMALRQGGGLDGAQQKAWANVGMLVLVILGYIALVCLLGFLYTKLWADPVLGDIKAKEADSFSHAPKRVKR
eukprot:g32698.t1